MLQCVESTIIPLYSCMIIDRNDNDLRILSWMRKTFSKVCTTVSHVANTPTGCLPHYDYKQLKPNPLTRSPCLRT